MPITQPQLIEFLSETDYFESIQPEQTAALAELFKVIELDAGAKIFEEGDPGDAWYLIIDGEIRISKTIPGHPDHVLATLEAYEGFGEMSLLDSANRMASAAALRPTALAYLPRATFLGLVEENHPAAFQLMQRMSSILCQRLRETTWVLQNIVRSPEEGARKNAGAVEMVIRVVSTQQ